jgi:hypothetical protein
VRSRRFEPPSSIHERISVILQRMLPPIRTGLGNRPEARSRQSVVFEMLSILATLEAFTRSGSTGGSSRFARQDILSLSRFPGLGVVDYAATRNDRNEMIARREVASSSLGECFCTIEAGGIRRKSGRLPVRFRVIRCRETLLSPAHSRGGFRRDHA